jgi:iron complex transport system permease protein
VRSPAPIHDRLLIAALCLLLATLAVTSLAIGPAHLSRMDVLRGLLEGTGVNGIIIRDIRLPRLILSLSVGATLGLCGGALQGLLRNPLAEPAIFGAPQAAAFGAVAVLYSGAADAFSYALPAAAVTGAAAGRA